MVEEDNKSVIYFVHRTPQGALPFGPFVNKNHFAGWMIMAMPIVFAYLCALTQASWRAQGGRLARWLHWMTRPEAGRLVLMAVTVVIMGTSIVLTKSRSGIGAFAIVMLVLTGFIARRATRHVGRVIAAVAMASLLIGAVQLAGSGETISHFARASQDLPGRLQAWRDTARIIGDFHWFGTGLGSYWMAMLVYQSGPRDQIFFQAHNDYLQLAAEGGLLVVIPALLALTVLAALALRFVGRREDLLVRWIRAGAIAGLVGMAAQSTLEFSLQLAGVTALCVILLALATHRSEERPSHARRV
jgi:O-antigen ligase